MELFDSIILGIVQGVTEFLPISSSAHLALIQQWLKIDDINALASSAVLHFATALAIMFYFWTDIMIIVRAMLRKLGRLPVNEKDVILLYAVVLGIIPAVVFGIVLEPLFAQREPSIGLIASMLVVSSILMMYVEWRYYLQPTHEVITTRKGLLIGLFQALSLLPGFSRPGSTIAGGMMLGLSRYEAARFSFLLAMSVTLGVGTKKLIDLIQVEGTVAWGFIFISAVVAFVTALSTIHLFLNFIKQRTLWPFIWCNVILAALAGYVAFIA
jgi:undecaprenyl-diphosphatase